MATETVLADDLPVLASLTNCFNSSILEPKDPVIIKRVASLTPEELLQYQSTDPANAKTTHYAIQRDGWFPFQLRDQGQAPTINQIPIEWPSVRAIAKVTEQESQKQVTLFIPS